MRIFGPANFDVAFECVGVSLPSLPRLPISRKAARSSSSASSEKPHVDLAWSRTASWTRYADVPAGGLYAPLSWSPLVGLSPIR
jgi:hypothetical protein